MPTTHWPRNSTVLTGQLQPIRLEETDYYSCEPITPVNSLCKKKKGGGGGGGGRGGSAHLIGQATAQLDINRVC